MFKWEDLGEKTLSKIAKLAISSQIEDVKELEVQIKTNPNLLAKGGLESLIIEAKDIQVTSSFVLDQMRIVLLDIEVNPMKALMGKIKLSYPSQGTSYFYISQKSLLQNFTGLIFPPDPSVNSCSLEEKKYLDRLQIKTSQLNLSSSGEIYLKLEFFLDEQKEIQEVELILEPYINPQEEVQLKIKEYLEGKSLSNNIINIFLQRLVGIFSLTDLIIDGLSFKVNKIIVEKEQVILQAKTQLTHFPSGK